MMSGFGKGKKAKLDKEAGGSDACFLELLQSVANIKAIQDELTQINARADKEALKLERKFDAWRKPFYARRNEVIQLIRDFWLVTFCNHPIMGDLLTEEDKKIFKNLVSLEVEEVHNVKPGFSISFSFSPNPYFEDEKLTKRYWFDNDGYLTVESDPINWKDSKGIFDGCSFDKEGKRPHTSPSFFCWFSDVVRFDGEVDELANIIKGDLWPNPLQYFQKVDVLGSHGLQDSHVDSQNSEVTGGGNEADDEREEGEEDEDHYMEDVGSCTAENNEDGEHNQDYYEEEDEYDEGYQADVDEDDDTEKDN